MNLLLLFLIFQGRQWLEVSNTDLKRQRASQVVPFATTNTQKNRARIHL